MRRLAALLSAGLVLAASPVAARDLPGALADALARAPALAAADAEVAAAEARRDQARAAGGPTARIEGSIGAGRIDPQNFFGLAADEVTPRAVQVVAEYPLYTGGRIASANAQSEAGISAARAMQQGTRHRIVTEVVASYAEVLTARQLVASYTELNTALTELVRGAQLRFEVGDAASTDVAQARARLAEGRAGLIASEGRLLAARSRLGQLTGDNGMDLLPLSDLPGLPTDLDEALDLARANNAMQRQAQAGVEGAEAGARAARASRAPTVGAFAEAAHVRDQFFPDYRADSMTVGVRARWTFFDSGAGAARVREADAGLLAAQAREREIDERVTQAVIEAWQALATARQMVVAAREAADASAQALGDTRLEVSVGAKPQLAELDAARDAIAAAARLAEAQGQLHIAAYRLRALTGME